MSNDLRTAQKDILRTVVPDVPSDKAFDDIYKKVSKDSEETIYSEVVPVEAVKNVNQIIREDPVSERVNKGTSILPASDGISDVVDW